MVSRVGPCLRSSESGSLPLLQMSKTGGLSTLSVHIRKQAQGWMGLSSGHLGLLATAQHSTPPGLRQRGMSAESRCPAPPNPLHPLQPPGFLSEGCWAGTQATFLRARPAGHSIKNAMLPPSLPLPNKILPPESLGDPHQRQALLAASPPPSSLPVSSEIRGHYHQGVRSEHSAQAINTPTSNLPLGPKVHPLTNSQG